MRRVPKVLRILSARIPVVVESRLIHIDHDGTLHKAYGMSYTDDLRIGLHAANSLERNKVTLIHEALHTMIEVAHVPPAETEEAAVTALAPLLLDFIRSNKAAIAWLQEVQ